MAVRAHNVIALLAVVIWAASVIFFTWIFCFKARKMKLPSSSGGQINSLNTLSSRKRPILKRGSGDCVAKDNTTGKPLDAARKSSTVKSPLTVNNSIAIPQNTADDGDKSVPKSDAKNSFGPRRVSFHKSVTFGRELGSPLELNDLNSTKGDAGNVTKEEQNPREEGFQGQEQEYRKLSNDKGSNKTKIEGNKRQIQKQKVAIHFGQPQTCKSFTAYVKRKRGGHQSVDVFNENSDIVLKREPKGTSKPNLNSSLELNKFLNMKMSEMPPPPSGYHVRKDFSNTGSIEDVANVFYKGRCRVGYRKLDKGLMLLENTRPKVHYRQRKLCCSQSKKPLVGPVWSELARNSVFYDYEPSYNTKSVSRKKKRNLVNKSGNAEKDEQQAQKVNLQLENSVVFKCNKYQYLLLKKRRNAKLMKLNQRLSHRNLNTNTNAKSSDTDLRDEEAREKKIENGSSGSGTSVVSADAYFSTRTDLMDGGEDTSIIELGQQRPMAEIRSDGSIVDQMDVKALHTDFIEPLRSQGDEPRPSKKSIRNSRHSPSPYPLSPVTDGIDSVVMDCMRNAMTEEISSQLVKPMSSGKPPATPETQHRTISSSGHKKRGSSDGSVTRSKGHHSKKSSLRASREENVCDEICTERSGAQFHSKSAIAKTDSSKEFNQRNLKTSSSSTPNLFSVADPFDQGRNPTADPDYLETIAVSPTDTLLQQVKQYKTDKVLGELSLVSPNKKSEKSSRKSGAKHAGDLRESEVSFSIDHHSRNSDITVVKNVGDDVMEDNSRSSDIKGAMKSSKQDLGESDVSIIEDNKRTSDSKECHKSNKHTPRRGRSPRKKSGEATTTVKELAPVLIPSRASESKAEEENNDADKLVDVNKKQLHVGLKKSHSLSPQRCTGSKKSIVLSVYHQSASHGNIVDSSGKSKPKPAKKPAKKKRVRIALMHDDSPASRRRKAQNTSPDREPESETPITVRQKSPPSVYEEKEVSAPKVAKRSLKKSRSSSGGKSNPEEYQGQIPKVEIFIKDGEKQGFREMYKLQGGTAVSMVDSSEVSPLQKSPSLTDISDKGSSVKAPTSKTKKHAKDKDLQSAETGWNNSVTQNAAKHANDRLKNLRKGNFRKMYKLTKSGERQGGPRDESKLKGDAESHDLDYPSFEPMKGEYGDDPKGDEVTKMGKEQKKSHSKSGKKDPKSKDSQYTGESNPKAHFARRSMPSPKINFGKSSNVSTLANPEVLKEEKYKFGSSVDKKGMDEGSSVDAPTFQRKDCGLRQARSGPSLGVGKHAQKDLDIAARRVKFARENAMNLTKQTRKSVLNSSSPNFSSINQPHGSPLKDDIVKAGTRNNDEQASPVPCRSTDLDQAAGFNKSRSPYRSFAAGRHPKKEKTLKSAPKHENAVKRDDGSPTALRTTSPVIIPTCENSTDYNVVNMGLNWMVQGFISRISFLNPSRDSECSVLTAAGDTSCNASQPERSPSCIN